MERIVTEEVEMKRIVWLMLLIPLLLGACGELSPYALTEFVGASATATITQMLTPIPPTMTATTTVTAIPTNTFTPTPHPVEVSVGNIVVNQGTALPEVEPITLENLDRLQLLAQWGYGRLYDVQLTADETQVVAATATGFYWFDAVTLEVVDFVPYAFDALEYTIILSPTGEFCAYITIDQGMVNLVNTADGQLENNIEGGFIGNIWFSPDLQSLFVSFGSNLKIWKFHSDELVETEIPPITKISFSADGTQYLTYSYEEGIIFRNEAGESISVNGFGNLNANSNQFSLSPDGRYIAVNKPETNYVRIWDVENEEMIFDRCFAPYGCDNGSNLFDEPSGKLARFTALSGPPNWTLEVKFSPTGRYLTVFTSENYSSHRYLYRFNIESGMLIAKEEIPFQTHVLFSSNDRRYYTWGNTIQKRFMYEEGIAASAPRELGGKWYPLFSPDNSLIAVTSSDGNVEMLNSKTGETVASHNFIEGPNGYAFFHQSPQLLVGVGMVFNEPYIWNYETNHLEKIHVTDYGWYVFDTQVSYDDQLAMFSVMDDRGYLYDLKSQNLPENQDPMFGLFHAQKPEIISTGRHLFRIYTYSNEDPNPVLVDEVPVEYCDSAGYWGLSSFGDEIFCTGNHYLYIYDRQGEILHSIRFWNYDSSPLFSSDDSMIFVAEESTVFIYGVDVERKVLVLSEAKDIDSFTLSSDGNYLVISSEDGTLRIWGVPTGE